MSLIRRKKLTPPAAPPTALDLWVADQHKTPELTPELIDRIVTTIEGGSYIEDACLVHGFDSDQFYGWMDRAAEDRAAGRETCYTALSRTLKRAHARATEALLAEIRAANVFWQAKAWILERTRMARFGQRQLLLIEDVTGRVNIPPPHADYGSWIADTRRGLGLQALLARDAGVTVTAEEIVDAEMVAEGDDVEVVGSIEDGTTRAEG